MPLFDDFNRNGVLVVKEDSSPLSPVVGMIKDSITLSALQSAAPYLEHTQTMELITKGAEEVTKFLMAHTAYAQAIANGAPENSGVKRYLDAMDAGIAKQAEALEKAISESK